MKAPTKKARAREKRARVDALHARAVEIAAKTHLPIREVDEALRNGRSEADLLAFADVSLLQVGR